VSGVYLVLLLVFCALGYARGGELSGKVMECEPQRVIGDHRYWSFRIIEGRTCWYPGRPGKPKSELRWSRPSPSERVQASEAEQPGRIIATTPSAAPAREEVMPDATARGSPRGRTGPGGGSDNATPPPLTEELTAGALTTLGVQRLLEARGRELAAVPLPSPPVQREHMSIWMLVSFVIAVVGVASLFPIIRAMRST
jgi:hypothetical protein